MIVRFGDLELDEEARTLVRRAGHEAKSPVSIPLQPKAFDLLAYLVRNRHRMVSREELHERVWTGLAVSGASINRAVNAVRRALGDDARSPRFIETASRRGYRFVAEAVALTPPAASPLEPEDVAPASLPMPGSSFVGRGALLARLEQELERALSDGGRAVLLEGDAGIGKSRTAAELLRRAEARGIAGLGTWCDETAPPFWPFHQLLRSIGMEALLSGASPVAEATEPEPDEARYQRFGAIAAALRSATAARGLVLWIDDLHAADPSTLRLLQFLARELGRMRVLVVATARTDLTDALGRASAALLDLVRHASLLRISLPPLERGEIAACILQWAGSRPDPRELDWVMARSEGNPFFARELWLWKQSLGGERERAVLLPPALPSVPPSLSDLLLRRIDSLEEGPRRTLRAASVLGREIDPALLAAAVEHPPETVAAHLAAATRARLVDECDAGPQRHRFVHGLVPEAIYAQIDGPTRVAWHQRVAAELQRRPAPTHAELAALAHHACRGADAASALHAVSLARAAAEQATRMLAFEEAARLIERALVAYELAEERDPRERIRLLLALGRALSSAGEPARALAAYDLALEQASALGDAALEVRASLGGLGLLPALRAPERGRILQAESALERLAAGADARLQITGLGKLAQAVRATGDLPRAIRLADDAVARARRRGDAETIARALCLRTGLTPLPEEAEARLERASEALRLADEAGAANVALEARLQRASALLQVGELRALDEEIDAYARVSAPAAPPLAPWYTAVLRAMRCLSSGRFDDAEEHSRRAAEIGRRAGHPDAPVYRLIQKAQLAFLRGTMEQVEPALRVICEQAPDLPGLRVALALAYVELDRRREAQQALAAAGRRRFSLLPRDAGWLSNLALASLVAARLGDEERATALRELLAPHRARLSSAFVVVCNGAISHFLAALAGACGERDEAIVLAREAVQRNTRLELWPWAAHSELELAGALQRRRGEDDLESARHHAASALRIAERIGMPRVVTAATDLSRLLREPEPAQVVRLSSRRAHATGRRKGE